MAVTPLKKASWTKRVVQRLVDAGWWEPSDDGRLWPGRFWLRFWLNPKNKLNRNFIRLLAETQDLMLRSYQRGVEDGHRATLDSLDIKEPARKTRPALLH